MGNAMGREAMARMSLTISSPYVDLSKYVGPRVSVTGSDEAMRAIMASQTPFRTARRSRGVDQDGGHDLWNAVRRARSTATSPAPSNKAEQSPYASAGPASSRHSPSPP
jgi:hypothetical protein